MSYSVVGKRLLDVSVAGALLAVTSPVFVAVAAVLWAAEGRPALFVQERSGRNRETFRLLKFRTMKPSRGGDERGSEADRISRIGAFLRSSSLDELPELVNVLRGEMSLVGPRPLPLHYTPYFRPNELGRFDVRPGITGLAQVSGRNQLSWSQRFALDVEYVGSMSLRTDLSILWRTLNVTARSHGVVVDPGGAMQDLDVERSLDVDRGKPDGN